MKIMKLLDTLCKIIGMPIFVLCLIVALIWLEFVMWYNDKRDIPNKGWHYFKEYFKDLWEAIVEYWNDAVTW